MKNYWVYILTNKSYTLYVGVTNNPLRRVWEHKHKKLKGFTAKYNIDKLIYLEQYNDIRIALNREKEIKGWNRKKKIEQIKSVNPTFEEIHIAQTS